MMHLKLLPQICNPCFQCISIIIQYQQLICKKEGGERELRDLSLTQGSLTILCGLPMWLSSKESPCQCKRHRRCGIDPWVGRSPGGGNGNPFQNFCLENPMDRGAWRPTVHGITESTTTDQLSAHGPLTVLFD